MAYGDVLAALADPTRRRVFERLRSGPRPVGAIARGMPVSRPAVSQHLKALKEAGLVADRQEGTRRGYFIDPPGVRAVRRWLRQVLGEGLGAVPGGGEFGEGERKGKGRKRRQGTTRPGDKKSGA